MKLTKDKALASQYKSQAINKDTNNIFAFFVEKALQLGNHVSLIVPKSLINAPEFNKTREIMNSYSISHLIDFGEKAFKGVKIETISFTVNTERNPEAHWCIPTSITVFGHFPKNTLQTQHFLTGFFTETIVLIKSQIP